MVTSDEIRSAEEFVRLRVSDDPNEYRIATHANAPIKVWMDILNRYPDMKEWVAHNKTVPLEILQILLEDKNPLVRSVVASKRKLTATMFEKLSRDPDVNVRLSLAHNQKTPPHVVDVLQRDESVQVRAVALKR